MDLHNQAGKGISELSRKYSIPKGTISGWIKNLSPVLVSRNDGIDMDDEPEAPKSEKEVADRPEKNIPLVEKEVGTGPDKGIRQYTDASAERVYLKAKVEAMKAKVAVGDTEKPMPQKAKGKEETL